MDSRSRKTRAFFQACLQKRLSPEKFRSLFITFQSQKTSLHGPRLIQCLFAHEPLERTLKDPRLIIYIKELVSMRVIYVADVLSSLLPNSLHGLSRRQSDIYDQQFLDINGVQKPTIAALVLQMMTVEIGQGLLRTDKDVHQALASLIPLISIAPNSMALGYFVSAVFATNVVQNSLSLSSAKKFRMAFGRSLTMLINHLMQTNIELATTLGLWQKQYELVEHEIAQPPEEDQDGVHLDSLTFQGSVVDTPPVNTRAGLYLYLNAVLHDRPLFNDQAVIDYLAARYRADTTILVIDLILASFDVLANAMYRSESNETLAILRSYLVNKLPVFLLNYVPMLFEPMTVEYCIGQAFLRIDPAAFPSFSQMFDSVGRNSMLSEARVEFLIACALHQLIPEQSIETLLGEDPMQNLPASGRYVKQQLVEQCTANPARIEELAKELENMEGNAGEIAGALLEIMHSVCAAKDTMTLKVVCNCLSRWPVTLDVLMLFTSASDLLKPLCDTLDNWQMHEDQGEHQPVYDEFGSVLLFIMLVQSRFGLGNDELGIGPANSFILQYIAESARAKSLEDLSEKEHTLLGAWVRGLFNESEGINDELMAMSSPRDFHMIVTTLLDQSMKACQAGFLSMSTLKDGLEYLLDPFLLPSLVAGLKWFAHNMWETTEHSPSLDLIMLALTTLLKHRSTSSDSSALHSALLTIIAKPLSEALTQAQRRNPQRSDIGPLLETLNRQGQRQRREAAALAELEAWSSTQGGSLHGALKHTVQTLIIWGGTASTQISPPRYTHRQLKLTVQLLGAKAVLHTLIDELMSHATADSALSSEAAFDVIVGMLTAPLGQSRDSTGMDTPHTRQLGLVDALRAEVDDVAELAKKDNNRATVLVRVHRRVEAVLSSQTHAGNNAAVLDEALTADVLNVTNNLPSGDIDEVLGQANEQAAAMDFMAGGAGDFMNLS